MKLITFNKETTRTGRPCNEQASIRFTKQGKILFNQTAVKELDLKPGELISFSQDEENPDNWYLISGDVNGFEVKQDRSIIYITSSYITKAMLVDFFQSTAASVIIPIQTTPTNTTDNELKGLDLFLLLTDEATLGKVKEEQEAEA